MLPVHVVGVSPHFAEQLQTLQLHDLKASVSSNQSTCLMVEQHLKLSAIIVQWP